MYSRPPVRHSSSLKMSSLAQSTQPHLSVATVTPTSHNYCFDNLPNTFIQARDDGVRAKLESGKSWSRARPRDFDRLGRLFEPHLDALYRMEIQVALLPSLILGPDFACSFQLTLVAKEISWAKSAETSSMDQKHRMNSGGILRPEPYKYLQF